MLEFRNVSRSFAGPDGTVKALVDVSLLVSPGEIVAVKGPSGCGKTTLLLAAGGLLRPSGGVVLFDNEPMYARSPNERGRLRGEKIGFVFQQFHLLPYLSVLDNVLAPSIALPQPGARARALELIARFGLEHRVNHVPAQLSTGERQRTALARALLNSPALILADEPTGNLDETSGKTVHQCLRDFVHDGGAVLMVTHGNADDIAARTVRMQAGRLTQESALETEGGSD